MPNYLDAILSLEPDYEVSVIGDPAVTPTSIGVLKPRSPRWTWMP